jgi:DNA polymerase V
MTIFALVDCNNFYASCERAFNPQLEGKPIIVLSNNDGCVIARSNEAKKLGIQMGEPYFKCKDICRQYKISVFSSNYELYGDMSARVMILLGEACPEIEVYSIDEAFLLMTSYSNYDLNLFSLELRSQIKMCTGIPVSIGLGPTKTLAKIANNYAKKHTLDGVFNMCDQKIRYQILTQFAIADIWGVGRRIALRLKQFGINTAWDLKNADPKTMRREFSVVMEKMIFELNDISCIPLEEAPPPKKQIMSSRSFGRPVMTLNELEEAISSYASRACLKLRNQNSLACGVHVFIETNYFREDKKQYSNAINYPLIHPTSDTRIITTVAKHCIKKLFKANYEYKKVGIMLLDLIPESVTQLDLLQVENLKHKKSVMNIMDEINKKYGNNSFFLSAQGIEHRWKMQRNLISKRYTTHIHELAVVKCK